MLQLQTFILLVIMVGSLCAFVWGTHPEETMQRSQLERVHKAAIVSFH